MVWVSLVVHLGLIVVGLIMFRNRHPLCFAIAFYMLHLLMVCNIVFDIGATMGERLIFHSSVGFAIAAAWYLWRGFAKLGDAATGQKALAGVMTVLVVLAGYKTIARNRDWKNDVTLFAADIKTVPNSVLVCANVAASLITEADEQKGEQRKETLHKAIKLLDHALSIHQTMVASFMNRGIAWYKLGDMDKAKENLDTVKQLYPSYPTLPGIYRLIGEDYMRKGWDVYGKAGRFPEAINEFRKGIAVDSVNPDLWYNLGGAYFSNHQYPDAAIAWQRALRIKPDYAKAQQGLQAAVELMRQQQQGAPPQKK